MTILDYIPNSADLKAKGNGEWSGPCPICRAGTDRFSVWPDRTTTKNGKPTRGKVTGVWYCRKCPEGQNSGDTLALIMAIDPSLKYPEAAKAVGYEQRCERGRAYPFAQQNHKRPAEGRPDAFQPMPEREPGAQWQAKLAEWVTECQGNLTLPDCQAELARRYLSIDQAQAMGLGWNQATVYRQAADFGIDDGGRPRLKLPAGLVIPIQRKAGLNAIRIRRDQSELDAEQARLNEQARAEGREPKKADKYWRIRGSGSGHCILGNNPGLAIVCEAEIDAMRLAHLIQGRLTVLAIPAGGKPTLPEHGLLTQAKRIIIALDADEAGQKAAQWFLAQYPQAVNVTLPEGAGLGDLNDLALQDWIRAALKQIAPRQAEAETGQVPDSYPCPAEETARSRAMTHLTDYFNCYGLPDRISGRWIIYAGNRDGKQKIQQALQWARNHAEQLAQEWPKIPGYACTPDRILASA